VCMCDTCIDVTEGQRANAHVTAPLSLMVCVRVHVCVYVRVYVRVYGWIDSKKD